ncbi:MAG: peroxide stress protein YaaA [Cytophagales bacterium]|nr:peroxide stress protein YaaA [Cytophagales bacterium]
MSKLRTADKAIYMLFIISPAKALDFFRIEQGQPTFPIFAERADRLAQKLKKKSPGSLKKLFHVSEELAQLNYDRYQNWDTRKITDLGKKALFAFNGHVFRKIDVQSLKEDALQYANKHLRILSGMYGLLRPSDMILPHRLEMGTKWPVAKRNLYGYWTKPVTRQLNRTLEEIGTDILINLASNEYFKVVDQKTFKGRIIHIEFKEKRASGNYEVVSIYAKQARGLMCRYAFQHKVTHPEELIGFDSEGYLYRHELSDEHKFVFTRG